jgi:hypothetical protein
MADALAPLHAGTSTLPVDPSADNTEQERRPVAKPDGWTKSELVSQAKDRLGSFGDTTFDRIRKAANVPPSERGGKGQQRRYSRTDLRKLIKAVIGGEYRRKKEIATAWSDLLGES